MTSAVTGGAFRLMYRSHDLIAPEGRKVALGDLFTKARSNNKQQSITGALLLSGDWFVQTLEGDEDAVRSLFDRIQADPRHDQVSVLETRDVEQRAFPRWSMARVSPDESAEDTYLIAHQDGISPASSRGTSPEQETVLDTMRQAVRGEASAQLG